MTGTLDELLQTADTLLLGGDVDEALHVLEKAIHAAPNDPLPYFRKGELLAGLGDEANLRTAWLNFIQAITLGLESPEVYFKLMRTLADLGETSAAREVYEKALALAPYDARLREWGIRLAIAAGDLPDALARAEAELGRSPENFYWMRWRAEVLLMMADYAAAREAFAALITTHAPKSITPGSWEASRWGDIWLKQARACRHLGDLDAAAVALSAAARAVPDEPGLSFEQGLLAWKRGDIDGAYSLLKAGLEAAAPDVRAGFWADLEAYPRRASLQQVPGGNQDNE